MAVCDVMSGRHGDFEVANAPPAAARALGSATRREK